MNVPYTIEQVQPHDYDQAIAFVMQIRKTLFPMLDHSKTPNDLRRFEQHYSESNRAAFLAAFNQSRKIIGTIGFGSYDGRFDHLLHNDQSYQTAEVVKCYTDPSYRRIGLGTALVKEATRFAVKSGYEMLYLHTHLFLPGAVEFWHRQGFSRQLTENDPLWQTVHMDKTIADHKEEKRA